ncbi:phospholipid N-methyltransferase [Saccharopolyspora lacisalsi]|uniref:Phospholipid N-methyltransferase n=1 Tax=Halosaccharopolyspora lacisalsi TaxID=1000566 RepID=A0A839E6S6_9PSEU|nr:methyltransferase domain-containing protein [Halosaccharopolyspora lacisalsi]MBA8827001.1 phospholipid N-methyltransferase [Halosaccharopolyspora lacisalsi]
MNAEQDHAPHSRSRPFGAGILDEYRTFLHTALRHPTMVGAATPTSSAVAATVAQVVPSIGEPVVVELGPGTGSLSGAISTRLPAGARHIGVELGEELVEHLRTHQPGMEIVHGDAGDLLVLLDKLGVHRVDAIISSIPWSLLVDDTRLHILRQCTEVLAPHGAFTALSYLSARCSGSGKHFHQQLETTFDEVLTHTTWLNFPPLMHYICRRPI